MVAVSGRNAKCTLLVRMETLNVIENRRAVRDFADAPVPRPAVERLIHAAILAPTCWIGLSRPWFNLPAAKRELGVPAQYQVIAPIVLGYPKAWPGSPGRRPAEIHWIG